MTIALRSFLFIVCFFVIGSSPVAAIEYPEYISQFDSQITINADTSISINETIHYYTSEPKHGIYREIPISYARNGSKYTTKITNITVTDSLGSPVPFEKSVGNGHLTLKIGDADTTFVDDKIYHIAYTTSRALHRFEKHDELYWDITGEGWQVPILQTNATVFSPHASIDRVACYSGEIDSNDNGCLSEFIQNKASFSYANEVNYGKNVTVAIGLTQPNTIAFPTPQEKRLQMIFDNWPLFLIPLPLLYMIWWWYTKGRDEVYISANVFSAGKDSPTKKQPLFSLKRTPFVYEPLSLSPGEAGVVLDQKADNQDVVAEIIELARKKYLKIEAVETKGLFKTSTDYRFVSLKKNVQNLPEQQEYLLTHLFETADSILVSELKGTFYVHMEAVKKILNTSMATQALFTASPEQTRITAVVVAIILSLVVFMPSVLTDLVGYSSWPWVLLCMQTPFALLIALFMPARTALGSNLEMQAKGLRQTIRYGKWREMIKEKHLFIEEILPFAISLGVVSKLARDMDRLNIQPPSYFSGVNSSIGFNSMMHSFTTSAGSNLSHNPSSSGWSSGSGFSGGSSGGGGGGGGGGSW